MWIMVAFLSLPMTKSSKQVSDISWYGMGHSLLLTCSHNLCLVFPYSAYEIMSEQQRRENHMQYGLALCSHSLDNKADNNEVFFAAITQINHGGPSVDIDPKQKNIVASLNLEAGKLSITLSDYTAALALFEHGISFLGDDKWEAQYRLSLDLFDAAAEASCMLNKNADVVSYTEQIITHAASFDDSLNCEYGTYVVFMLYPLCRI